MIRTTTQYLLKNEWNFCPTFIPRKIRDIRIVPYLIIIISTERRNMIEMIPPQSFLAIKDPSMEGLKRLLNPLRLGI